MPISQVLHNNPLKQLGGNPAVPDSFRIDSNNWTTGTYSQAGSLGALHSRRAKQQILTFQQRRKLAVQRPALTVCRTEAAGAHQDVLAVGFHHGTFGHWMKLAPVHWEIILRIRAFPIVTLCLSPTFVVSSSFRLMLRTVLVRAALLALAMAPAAAQGPSTPLPRDSAVVTGRLSNGLRYFIRHNAKPEKRAELRLVVNAGSILENDAQRGLAHFVEHMAFNGTARFPKAAIVNFLERVGMRFGADVNAYTSFDETVYMLQIPTDTARLVNTGLDILEDWAHNLSFDPVEIRKERGVVIEEWRTGRDASTRVSYRQFPVMLRGSQYAIRIPIGTKENLETFPDSLAKNFYRDWYRPDLMSVVAVGDFDVKEMEAKIRERFGRIPAAVKPRPRLNAPVPDHAETLVSIETDKEYPAKTVSLLWLKPHEETRTTAEFRRTLVSSFYDGMMNQRFHEMTSKPDAPFAFGGSGRGELVRTKDVYQLEAGVKDNGFVSGAEALLAEAERVRRFGFTPGELDRQRVNYLRDLEQAYAERDKSESAGFADEYVGIALTGGPMMSIGEVQSLSKELVPGITLDEINALARTTFTETNRVAMVAAPEKADVTVPSAEQLLAVYGKARDATLTAYVDETTDAALVPVPPVSGKIVAERTLPETGILEWTLSNGAKLLLKPTDFKADEVYFAGQAPGGSSLLEDRDVPTAVGSPMLFQVSGIGAFDRIALGKKLTGIKADASTSFSGTEEVVNGSASRRDIETLFQLVWLRFTQPRVDTAAFQAIKNQAKSYLANQHNEPETVFGDTIAMTMSRYSPRTRIFTPELLDSVDLGRALTIYNERFANAGNFTFFLVGSFAPDSVRPFVERYLASLPTRGVAEKAVDRGVRPPTGVVTRTVKKGIEPKAQTELIFTGSCAYSYENRFIIKGLRELLNIRLREVLREDKSGTYGVSVSGSCYGIPYQRYQISISFGSAPERTDELTKAVFAVIDSVKAGAVSDSNMTKIREITIRQHETALKENDSWLSAMTDAAEDGRDQRDWLRTPELASKLTKTQLRDAARLFLNTNQYARFTLLPEDTPKPPPIKP
jgi:zinc protease